MIDIRILTAKKVRHAAKPAFIHLINLLPFGVSVAFLKDSPVKNVSNTVYAASTKPIMAGTTSFASCVTVFNISKESLSERQVPMQIDVAMINGSQISFIKPLKT